MEEGKPIRKKSCLNKYADMKPISVVIITYNRPDDALDLARNISGLEGLEEWVEEVIIVNIIKYEHPPTLPFVMEPVIYELIYIGFRVLPAKYF